MHDRLVELQGLVRTALDEFFDRGDVRDIMSVAPWGPQVRQRLAAYARNGKMIRGALVGVGSLLYHGSYDRAAADLGVVMELLQTFLLVHDDIMDGDDTRRGQPAIHAQLRNLCPDASRAQHYGESLGVCVGDVAAFLAQYQLAALEVDAAVARELQRLISAEIVKVGLAQMQDVHHGYEAEVSPEAIRAVYTLKTGRYTFSLPLMCGALLHRAEPKELERLGRIGEALGRVFQIRDDQLGLFGDERATGKPVGSDIRENKKTLHRHYLMERSAQTDRLRAIFGAREVSVAEVEFVRAELRACGVAETIEAEIERDEALIAAEAAGSAGWHVAGREVFEALVAYNRSRTI